MTPIGQLWPLQIQITEENWRMTAILKTTDRYLNNGLTDRHEVCLEDALCPC